MTARNTRDASRPHPRICAPPWLVWCVLAVATLLLPPVALQGCLGPGDRVHAPAVRTAPETIPSQPSPADAKALWENAERVLDARCVVCHGCYDAPCQLKLGAYEGIDRGGTDAKVYDAARLVEAAPTRLFVDARSTDDWRKKGFHAVVSDGATGPVDPRSSVLLRMLDLKDAHPLAPGTDLAREFTLDLDRAQSCVDAADFDDFAKKHPSWGMPYALPALDPAEHRAIAAWVEAGAPHDGPEPLPPSIQEAVATWETFLNEPSLKRRLAARYVYEHLFLATLHFDGVAGAGHEDAPPLFRIVRSRTPIGPIDEIATRRPFDDPGGPVYYRLARRTERTLAKTQMLYALSPARLALYRKLFVEAPFAVTRLPAYSPEVASNPFRAFEALPVASRYRFMLDDAELTMMGFIKGPVCRGQVALDVIEDRFWVVFTSPDAPSTRDEALFLAGEKIDLTMPAASGSDAGPTAWFSYATAHDRYVKKRNRFLTAVAATPDGLALSAVWNGDGHDPNAGLTVFRHFDSASVVEGFVGGPPKTAWVVDYPLLERIHYLLVAGFDVFGNVAHQVTSRLYMDFLRMEAESNFLALLPAARRRPLIDAWYRGVSGSAKDRVVDNLAGFTAEPKIAYSSEKPELELFGQWKAHLRGALADGYDLSSIGAPAERAALEAIGHVVGQAASLMPEVSFVEIASDKGKPTYATILRDTAHTNVSHLFEDSDRHVPTEDALVVTRGFLGAYPNALFSVREADLETFARAVAALDGDASYARLRASFGVRRDAPTFWRFADRLQQAHRQQTAIDGGLLDFSRLNP
jgi:hypothetical protein